MQILLEMGFMLSLRRNFRTACENIESIGAIFMLINMVEHRSISRKIFVKEKYLSYVWNTNEWRLGRSKARVLSVQ